MAFNFGNRLGFDFRDNRSGDGENSSAIHIPVQDANAMCDESAGEDDRAPKHIKTPEQQMQQGDEAIAAKDAQIHHLESRIEQLEEDLRIEREKAEKLADQYGSRGAELQAATDAADQAQAILAEKDATIEDPSRSVEALNQEIAKLKGENGSLRQSCQQIKEKHLSLLHELEEGTDKYAARKKSALEQYTRDALAAWSRTREAFELASPADEDAWDAEEANRQLQEKMQDTTTSFFRGLNELGETIHQLDATRNAMRKELDSWQQGLFAARYDRLALCLQTFDAEIWRMRKAKIELVAEQGVSEATDTDELLDRLEMLSGLFKDACANFGLHFFWPAQGDAYHSIRHKLYSGGPESTGTLRVEACVAPGVESSVADGETALLRPALVTVVCDETP